MPRRVLLPVILILSLLGLLASPAVADHGLGHNGETMELSEAEELEDGQEVTVDLSSFLPGVTATVVTCFVFPVVGPTDCDLSNYGQYTVDIADDGTGTIDYPVSFIPGMCDPEINCFVVAGDGIGPSANYAGEEVTFAAEGGDDGEPEPEPTATPVPEPTEEPEPTATPADSNGDEEAAQASDDDDGSNTGLIVGVIIAVLVLGGGGAWLYMRNRSAA